MILNDESKRFEVYLNKYDFYKTIEEFLSFLECVSNNIFQNHLDLRENKIRQYNYGFESSIMTVKGIVKLCEIGDFVDVFVLLRKIRDNVLLDYFFINDLVNNNPKIENCTDLNMKNLDELMDTILKYMVEKEKFNLTNPEKQIIEKWYHNQNKDDEFKKTYKYSKYKKVINKESEIGKYLYNILDKIDRILNDYTHTNGVAYSINPSMKEGIEDRIMTLINCIHSLENVFVIYAFYIDPLLLQSSDYIDCLDMGYTPNEEYKYYLFKPALEIFERIKKDNPTYFEILKDDNKYGMFIEKSDYNN